MLSYRHGFHAGGPADLLKHAVLQWCIDHALRKPAPLYLLDSHAGAGLYDLTSAMAAKTAEWQAGILPAMRAAETAPALLRPLLDEVLSLNPGRQLARYPGSAWLAARRLRDGDRLELAELHGTDHGALDAALADRPPAARLRVTREDGLALMVGRMPPAERRAIVLVDPSFEVKADYADVPAAVLRAWLRFPTGTFILWVPVIERARSAAVEAALIEGGVRRLWRAELAMAPDAPGRGMTGSVLLVINPPFTLPAAAEEGLSWLAATLGATGPTGAEWLVGE